MLVTRNLLLTVPGKKSMSHFFVPDTELNCLCLKNITCKTNHTYAGIVCTCYFVLFSKSGLYPSMDKCKEYPKAYLENQFLLKSYNGI